MVYITKELKNKTVLSLKQYWMHCYVALSNVFYIIDAYSLLIHGSLLHHGKGYDCYKVCCVAV